jgi:hypothetical protein
MDDLARAPKMRMDANDRTWTNCLRWRESGLGYAGSECRQSKGHGASYTCLGILDEGREVADVDGDSIMPATESTPT